MGSEVTGMVVVSARRVGSAEAALRLMLLLHGLGGVFIGSLMMADSLDGPSFSVLKLIPGWPVTWGLILIISGAVTAIGRSVGHLVICRAGGVFQTCWYVAQATGFAWAAYEGASRYPAAIYGLFAAVMVTHLVYLSEHGQWRYQ